MSCDMLLKKEELPMDCIKSAWRLDLLRSAP
jgi:hypothetical protein